MTDHPTRPLNRGDAPLPPEQPTRRLDADDEAGDSPRCPKCRARMSRGQLTGAKIQIGSRRSIPGPYTMDCVVRVCVDCGYTELYAVPGKGSGKF